MRILLQRHGESEANLDERFYITEGDQNISLTPTGWMQGINGGKFLRTIYGDKWPLIYCSFYLRTKQMLAATLHGIGNSISGKPVIYEEPRLIERYLGARNIIEYPEGYIDEELATIFKKIANLTLRNDPYVARNFLGESDKEHWLALKNFIDGTFARDVQEGQNDFLIVAHGATITTFVMIWAHIPMTHRRELPRIENGDIIEINGGKKQWTYRKIFDGPSGEPVDIDILNGIKPFNINDLPPVPPGILKEYEELLEIQKLNV